MNLLERKTVIVKQIFEAAELFGFETRNKYSISDENHNQIGFAAEQQKGFFGFLFRQVLGHWRKYDIHFYNNDKKEFLVAHHPFRFFFQRLEIETMDGKSVGAIQQRFSILSKKFDIQDSNGSVLMEMRSPIWKIWTFPITKNGQEVAKVEKKWTGLLAEAFTDKDTFKVSYLDESLNQDMRSILLVASVFIDMQYFEQKAD